MKKLVLTGAAGNLGSALRGPLAAMCDELVSTDQVDDLGKLNKGERYVKADLADLTAIKELSEGADMIIHFGAIPDEAPFDVMLGPNFIGAYNVWEAAHVNGIRRVVYASSIHAVGMYPKTEFIGTDVPHRPDTFYGLSKCFSEDLGRMYWEKRGIESVCMRIASCTPEVGNARAVGSWLSYPDLVQMVSRAVDTPITGFTIVYGVSNNDRAPVDNSKASFLGYRPQDNGEERAAEMFAAAGTIDPQDNAHMCHGGPFAVVPLGESGVAMIKASSVKKT